MEQREVDVLRATVSEEQTVIATETEQVAILKKVKFCFVRVFFVTTRY